MKVWICAVWVVWAGAVCARPQADAGAYLGMPLPGATPELFAPDWVSTGLDDRGVSVSPDGRLCAWFVITGSYTTVMLSRRTDAGWSRPETAPFSGREADFEPAFSSDGSRLYFASNRPHPTKGARETDADLWVVAVTEAGWGTPRPLSAEINTEAIEYFPTPTRSGALYFGRVDLGTGAASWLRAPAVADGFGPPEPVTVPLTDPGRGVNVCVDPDERFLVFPDARPGDRGDSDFFVSYRGANGTWQAPRPLNLPFRTLHGTEAVRLSPDGRFLFLSYADQTAGPGIWGRPAPLDHGRPLTRGDLLAFQAGPGNGRLDVYWVAADILPKPAP